MGIVDLAGILVGSDFLESLLFVPSLAKRWRYLPYLLSVEMAKRVYWRLKDMVSRLAG